MAEINQKLTTEEDNQLKRRTKKVKNHPQDQDPDSPMGVLPSEHQHLDDQMHEAQGPQSGQPARSFKEILVGDAEEGLIDPNQDLEHEDDDLGLSDQEKYESEDKDTNDPNDDSMIPDIKQSNQILMIRQPWQNAIIVKLLGKSIGYKMLCNRVRKLWDLQGDYEALDLGCGYFLFKFDSQTDCTRVVTGGPWVMMDHYLMVRHWEPNFRPSSAHVLKTAMWVRLPELPVEYYDERILMEIGRKLGKPLKIDGNTVVCFDCGRASHMKEQCRFKPLEKEPTRENIAISNARGETEFIQQSEAPKPIRPMTPNTPKDHAYGPWMLVTKKPRRINQPNPRNNEAQTLKKDMGPPRSGSRFSAVRERQEYIPKDNLSKPSPTTSKFVAQSPVTKNHREPTNPSTKLTQPCKQKDINSASPTTKDKERIPPPNRLPTGGCTYQNPPNRTL
ncbi:hypothetical protein F0562_028037 [Nyssa sinensis]|uniref:CCHC-type domain-containing protein n=1 Tax=Nyssa sinensis TaxID=561372 RepID=A0A5J5B6Z5_9ASTE|nr:hypothetical protein F0562_028037 [Nyssa sinensis]